MKMSKLFGITGGIGSGKSVVSQVLRLMGYAVYDCDSRAKQLMNESGEIRRRLTAMFGSELYKDGCLDRRLLSEKIFNDRGLLADVNAVVHPVVKDDLARWQRLQTGNACFVESAILHESGLDKMVSGVIRVDAPEELRIARVVRRSGLSAQQVRERMANQRVGTAEEMAREYTVVNDECTPTLPQIMDFLVSNV